MTEEQANGAEDRRDAYERERRRAQAARIQESMDRRRHPGAPEACAGEYEVLER